MSVLSVKLKNKRDRLFMRHPYCYYCNTVLVHPTSCHKTGVAPPSNMATAEHLFDRLDPRRLLDEYKDTIVLACVKCNGERSNKRVRELPIYEKWERSGVLNKVMKSMNT